MPWESITLAGVAVSLSEPPPSHVIRGVAFLLTGAMIPEKEYESTRRVLCMERGLVVIGLYINVLTTAHAWYAEKIPLIYQAYQQQQRRTTRVTTNPTNHDHRHHHSLHNNPSSSTISYKEGFHVVGHSVGGKSVSCWQQWWNHRRPKAATIPMRMTWSFVDMLAQYAKYWHLTRWI